MGRAIDVDKRIHDLEYKVNEILLILDELGNVNTTQEHIDLHEETKNEKTNDEGSGEGDNKSNSRKSGKSKRDTKDSKSSK